MNRHLSSQEVSAWVLGERSPEAEQHVRACPACGAEVARFGDALAHFRSSVHQWSAGSLTQVNWAASEHRAWISFGKLCSALAVLTVCVLLTLLVVSRRERKIVVEAGADAAVLHQVDVELARDVPRPMEPLMKLVSWDENSGPRTAGRDAKEADSN